jgi:hypothetical protein
MRWRESAPFVRAWRRKVTRHVNRLIVLPASGQIEPERPRRAFDSTGDR